MAGKQVTELDALPNFTDTSLLPVHNGAGLKKGLLSQLANYLGNKFGNPNILINPKFEINQRGSTTYTTGYTVDRWRVVSATLNAKTKTLSNPNSAGGTFLQSLENKPTGTFTVTLNVASVTGTVKFSWKDGSTYKTGAVISKGLNTYTFTASSLTWVGIDVASGASIQLDYMKLEKGTVATPFIAPNSAEELLKCQRYFMYLPSSMTGYRFNAEIYVYIENLDKMRTDGTIGITGNNNDTNLLFGGNTLQKLKVNVNATSVNHVKKFAKVYLDGITSPYHDTTLGIDMNSTKIYVDAEIY